MTFERCQMPWESKEDTCSEKFRKSQTTQEYLPGSETEAELNSDEKGFITVSAPAPVS